MTGYTVHGVQRCNEDETQNITETVNAAFTVSTEATCETSGSGLWTAVFTKTGFENQTKPETIPALDHNWGEVVYVWSEDNTTATATRVCRNDETHIETETVNTTDKVTKAPTCEEKGETTYTAIFENAAFGTKTLTVADTDALGHDWSAVIYGWSTDNTVATATRTCRRDSSHFQTEVVETTSEITKVATCEEKGERTWTAVFKNEAFGTQAKTETIPALGHDWSEPSFTWAEDGSTATATRVCGNDKTHVEAETVSTTARVTKEATCEEKGETTYTAIFRNAAFGTKTLTIADIDELGHDWSAVVYGWSADNTVATATRTCRRDKTHYETEITETTAEVTRAATCTNKGETTWTAVFVNEAFETQTKTDTNVPEDNSKVTATRVCANDETHIETETVSTTARVTKAPTCEEKGETTWTAVFVNKAFETQTKSETNLDALGHDWSEPDYGWSAGNVRVTAIRICSRDSSHVETEVANAEEEVTKPATCEEKGETTWTAVFKNEAFETQVKKETNLPAVGHDCTATWTWVDTAAASVTVTCSRCGHTVTKQAELSFSKQEAGNGEELVYTATAQAEGQLYMDKKTVTLAKPVAVTAGEKTTFTAPAGKDAYRWQYSKDGGQTWINCVSTGHDQAEFSFNASATLNGRLYRCIVTENGTEGITEATELSVLAITKQPVAQSVKEGERATFTVTANSDDVMYQWQVNKTGTWNNCTSTGNKTATFSFIAKTNYNGWQYRCVVSSANGSATSSVAKLTVTAPAPVITNQPTDQNVWIGETAVYTVKATESNVTYQWQYSSNNGVSWVNCKGAGYNTDTFSFRMIDGLAGRLYRCVISNAGGSTASISAKLTLRTSGPMIKAQPGDQKVTDGSRAIFTVTASGNNLTYQWQVNKTGTWNNCTSAGNKTATFSFVARTSYSGWQYRCIVTDSNGSVITIPVLLTVN